MSILSSDLRTLSREAYVYLYPLVTVRATRRQATNLPDGARPGFGRPNRFHHIRRAGNAFQDGWSIIDVSGAVDAPIDPDADTTTEPLRIINGLTAVDSFAYAAELLREIRPHLTDQVQVARMSLLGIVPRADFDAGRFPDAEFAELEAGRSEALTAMVVGPTQLATPVNGWISLTDTVGIHGTYDKGPS